MRNLNTLSHIMKCKLCTHNISELDYRHVYKGICFQCIFDMLFFIENNAHEEYENAQYYANQNARRKSSK